MTLKNNKKINKIMLLTIATIAILVATLSGCIGNNENNEIQTLIIDGSTTVFPIAQAAADKYMDQHLNVDIQITGTGSSNGITAVSSGSAHIGMASRELKSSEDQTLTKHVIAKDGIALIVHPTNTITELTIEQVKGIYNGTYTNWNQLEGPNSVIVVVGRDSASGTREFFYEHVMKKEESIQTMLEKNSNGAIHTTVKTTPGAIGYVGLGYVDSEVKAVSIYNENLDQYIEPSVENVITEKYSISRDLNMFTKGEPTGVVRLFIDYLLSSEGQEIVQEEGFVPINQ